MNCLYSILNGVERGRKQNLWLPSPPGNTRIISLPVARLRGTAARNGLRTSRIMRYAMKERDPMTGTSHVWRTGSILCRRTHQVCVPSLNGGGLTFPRLPARLRAVRASSRRNPLSPTPHASYNGGISGEHSTFPISSYGFCR
jgi:hypothetical protein